MHIMAKFLEKLFLGVGSPLADVAVRHVRSGEWRQLQELPLGDPASYSSAEAFKADAVVVNIFRKALLPGDKKKRIDNAKETFWVTEAQCLKTNARLRRFQDDSLFLRDSVDESVYSFIRRWRKEVRRVLGKASYNLEPSFSGGSTLSDSGMQTTIPDKMSSVPTCYKLTTSLYKEAFARTPQHERFPDPIVVRGNRYFTVPKDSFKDRGCCVEASAAVSLQLAVGKRLKNRFKKAYKVDLAHMPLRHQRLARLGSAGRRRLATIDLSNASDTIARELVKLILPSDWHTLLNSLRATHTTIDKKEVYLEKYSSMGNGFTFELETILYKTLCDTVIGSRSSSAFGDDMIVPTEHSAAVMAALRFFGFTPNEKKTFCEGPFRESCGGDYFGGTPVRTHFIKELPDEPQDWIALANGLKRMDPTGAFTRAAWWFCLDQLPKAVRECRGPKALGDIVIHDDDATPTFRTYYTVTAGKRHENSPTWFYRVYRPVQRTFKLGDHFTYRVATAAASLGVPELVSPRDAISGHKLDWVAAWGRNDFHGWLEA